MPFAFLRLRTLLLRHAGRAASQRRRQRRREQVAEEPLAHVVERVPLGPACVGLGVPVAQHQQPEPGEQAQHVDEGAALRLELWVEGRELGVLERELANPLGKAGQRGLAGRPVQRGEGQAEEGVSPPVERLLAGRVRRARGIATGGSLEEPNVAGAGLDHQDPASVLGEPGRQFGAMTDRGGEELGVGASQDERLDEQVAQDSPAFDEAADLGW